ncbi:MAG TPA: hypothetical protein VK638_29395 [Edaphobacter sp.]|nr:hypothetical protein [Edaphobacter sp.]
MPYLTGQQPESSRHEFFYFDGDGALAATRVNDWRFVWCEQRAPGGFSEWSNPLTCLRVGKVFNLRMDPYERADMVSDQHYDWTTKNAYLLSYGVMKTAEFLETFVDYPPSQIPRSSLSTRLRRTWKPGPKPRFGSHTIEASPWTRAGSLPARRPSADHHWQGPGLDGTPSLNH